MSWCPFCPRREEPRETRLADNGGYARRIPTAPGRHELGWIYRKYCSLCRVSFSLHPEFLVRRQRYALTLVAAWLWAWLQGVSCQSREFYQRQGIEFPEPPERASWSDWVREEWGRTRPGLSLLCRWGPLFARRAARHMEAVTRPLEELGIWKLVERASELRLESWRLPRGARPLVQMWLYREAALRLESTTGEVAVEEPFRRLVRLLAVRGDSVSHAVRRAFADRVQYDGLIIEGHGLGALPG